MKEKSQYNNFIESINSKINKAVDDIHIAISNKRYIFSYLKKYEYDIRKAGIDFDKLKEFSKTDINSSFSINKNLKIVDDEILNNILHSNLNTFIYLSYVKIDTLLDYIKYMTYISNISFPIYRFLIKSFNRNIVESLIKGDSYSFGFGLSSISIKRGKRSNNKKAIKWGESNKKRKEGSENWLSYHESPYYNFFYWNKSDCKISNYIFYNFKVTNFINTFDRSINNYYANVESIKQVIDDDQIGNLQKLNASVKLDPELINNYINN